MEEREQLLKECPELEKGLNEVDVNNYIIGLIQENIVLKKHQNALFDTVLRLSTENATLRERLARVEPLLRSVEEAS